MEILVVSLLGFIALKLYGINLIARPATAQAANRSAALTTGMSGIGPANGNPANPGPPIGAGNATIGAASPQGEEDDDGQMAGTVAGLTGAMGADPTVMPGAGDFDTNETQATSGAENPSSDLWRATTQKRGSNENRILEQYWAEAMDVDYMCAQPGILYQFQPPPVSRQDWNPQFNNQPWARNKSFALTDPTQEFDTDDEGYGPDEEDSAS